MNYKKETVISNTSPLISFLEIIPDGHLIMKALFDKVLIPEGVLEEITEKDGLSHEDYLNKYNVADLIEIHPIAVDTTIKDMYRLDKGESQAITLAVREKLLLLIDENKGRRVAKYNAGCTIEYTSEQLVKACRVGIITRQEAENHLKTLQAKKRLGEKLLSKCINDLP